MKTSEHTVSGEELMAHLDGELDSTRAAVVGEHLAVCESCRQVTADLQRLSSRMSRWQVEETPASLRPRPWQSEGAGLWMLLARRLPTWRVSAAAVAALVLVAAVGVWQSVSQSPASTFPSRVQAPPAAAPTTPPEEATRGLGYVAGTPGAGSRQAGGGRAGIGGGVKSDNAVVESLQLSSGAERETKGPLIARAASLSIVAQDFDAVRPLIDRVLKDAGGFIGRINVSGGGGAARSLSASLRVPSARLDPALASLKTIGKVIDEVEGGDDVTEQVRDLEVRVTNAKATEQRLLDVLAHRTGKVADVLEAEREIARVRGEIEQMDAERKDFDRRVSYATVSLSVAEERKAQLDLGPLSPSARLRNALVDGVRGAFDSAFGVLLWLLSAGPTLLVWAAVLAWPARVIWRRLFDLRTNMAGMRSVEPGNS